MLFLVANGPNFDFPANAVTIFRLTRIHISIAVLVNDNNGRPVVLGQAKYVHDLIAVHADKLATDRHPTKEPEKP